jgi:hypothetical protein
MKCSAVLLCAALLGCGHNDPGFSQPTDLQQLIEAALSSDLADARAGKHKVCVQREFEPPLQQTVEQWQLTKTVSTAWDAPWNASDRMLPHRIDAQTQQRLNRAIKLALAGRAKVTRASVIQSVPAPLILDSSGPKNDSECEREMPHNLETAKPNGPEEVSLTRPVFVDRFAFVEYASTCGGLCYGSSLRAFENSIGKWTYIAEIPLAVG